MNRIRFLAIAAVACAGLVSGCAGGVSALDAVRVSEVSEARLRADVGALARIGSAIELRREGGKRRILPVNLQSPAEKIAYLRSQLEPLEG